MRTSLCPRRACLTVGRPVVPQPATARFAQRHPVDGYQARGSGGRALLDTGRLEIYGTMTQIDLEIDQFSFSTHAGHDEIVALPKRATRSTWSSTTATRTMHDRHLLRHWKPMDTPCTRLKTVCRTPSSDPFGASVYPNISRRPSVLYHSVLYCN